MIDLSKLDPSEAEHLNSTHEDTIEDMRQTLLQCLPFFEDRKEELGDNDTRTMDFMIKLIKRTLEEAD